MASVSPRFEFSPPPAPGIGRAMLVAVLAHGLLVAALTWGVSWRRDASLAASAVELWSDIPRELAPKREAEKQVELTEKSQKTPKTSAHTPVVPPHIVTERDKKRPADAKTTDDSKRRDAETAKRLATERAALEAERQKQLDRVAKLAGTASPAVAQSSGPSVSYAGRIVARVRPNIVFMEHISGNPIAEVEVRTAPDGSILSRQLIKSSGVRAWDEAVLKAIDKTEVLPRDVDGRVPSSLIIGFRPRD